MRFDFKEEPTDVYGLKFKPSIDEVSDDADWITHGKINGQLVDMTQKHYDITVEFSANNKSVLLDVLGKLSSEKRLNSILEIGVFRSREKSSTQVILDNKLPETKYLGVDLDEGNLGLIRDVEKGVLCFQQNSSNIHEIMNYARMHGIETFDLILIDGWHSINQVVRDWRFAQHLSPGGVVLFHDTNYHPGPYCVFEAIDEKLFDKTKYFEDAHADWGIAKAVKKP